MRFGIPSAGMVGKQGVAAPVSSRFSGMSALLYVPAFASLCKRQPPIIQHTCMVAERDTTIFSW
jgi:hypothetical protein